MTEYGPHEWDRRPGERNLWYDRFTKYRLQGPDRSLLNVYNLWRTEKGKVARNNAGGAWNRRYRDDDWKARAEAWDAYQRELQEEEWQRRQEAHREDEWRTRTAMLDKAEQMLKFPLAQVSRDTQVSDSGQVLHVTEVHPAQWRFSDIPRFLDTASALGRRASGLPKEQQSIDILTAGESLNREQLSDGDRRSIIGALGDFLLGQAEGQLPDDGDEPSAEVPPKGGGG